MTEIACALIRGGTCQCRAPDGILSLPWQRDTPRDPQIPADDRPPVSGRKGKGEQAFSLDRPTTSCGPAFSTRPASMPFWSAIRSPWWSRDTPQRFPVTLDEIIYHAKMVVRGTRRALVIVDMPFLSFQVSPSQAIENAGRILKESGAAAVKLEGGVSQAETIRALTVAGIPVMAHVGMKPQSIHSLGGMGKIQRDEENLLRDAKAAEEAGAFAIVLELIPQTIAQRITRELTIPTIGIGAGPACDGQVLVRLRHAGPHRGLPPAVSQEVRRPAIASARRGEPLHGRGPSRHVSGPEHSH